MTKPRHVAGTVHVRVHQPGAEALGVAASAGTTLFDALRAEGLQVLHSPCGGEGTCGKCVLRHALPSEAPRFALACRTVARDGEDVWVEQAKELEIQADFRRPFGAAPAVTSSDGYRIAIDVGTTTIAADLVAPLTGEVVARVSDRNHQSAYGADVIARIAKSRDLGVDQLAGVLRAQLAGLAAFLLDTAGVPADQVAGYTIAGNTVMQHFVEGLSPESIGQAPFAPLSLFGDRRPAADLGLPGRVDAEAYLAPAIAGYVGGDIVSGLLACGLDASDQVVCLLDLGTNGEIALATPAGIVACATAAGPAFEGAEIECGMPAITGAVNRVRAAAGQLRVGTIAGAVPIGICGSGLVDVLAAALELGLVDETGRLRSRDEVREPLWRYLAPDGTPRILLVEDGSVYLTQRDIRQLQLAKGAVAAGLDVLLAETGLAPSDVDRVLLAGGFGTRVNVASLETIGMLPTGLAARATAVGNAALAGAVDLAVQPELAERAGRIAGSARYLELSEDPRFTEAFMERISFAEPEHCSVDEALTLASGLGFEVVHELDPATLVPMHEVRAMCAADSCRMFGRNWCCPPAVGTVAELGARMATYRRGVLVQTVGTLEDQFDLDSMTAAEKLHKRRFRQLAQRLRRSYPRQFPLGAGTCDLCPTCTYPDAPCKLPGIAYVSMEACGLLVSQVCESNGAPYYHGPLTISYTSCVLLE